MSDASLWITILAVLASCAALALAMVLRDRLTAMAKALERDHGRMQAVLEAAVDGVVIIDARGTVESINSAVERIFGYTAEEVVGRNVSFLMPEPYRSQHDGYLAAYLATGTARIIGIGREVEGLRKDGTTFPMDLAVGESRIDGRRLFAGIVRDISERKDTERRLRTGEAKTRAILEAAADGILTIDQAGTVLGLNAAAERIFGYEATEVIGRNVKMLMPEPDHSAHDSYLRHYIDTGERRIIGIGREVEGRRKSGAVFPMDLAVGEAMVGGERFFTGIVRDATERKR
ncbi:MAG: PAS domain S-box protein, partial [Alphaproteobacteria bacterium]|nr:PAS domain S-box protein [Alphaproteobacteria bacterium]